MKQSKNTTIMPNLVAQSQEQILSPVKVKFNTLIKRIQNKRLKLKTLQDTMPILHQTIQTEFNPVLMQYRTQQANLLIQLDEHYQNIRLTKKEKKKLFEVIAAMSTDCIGTTLKPDLKIKEIYDRYNQTSFDQERAEEQAYHKNMLEEILGSKIDDKIDLNDMDSLMSLLSDNFDALVEDEAPKREKTAKQLEKEAQHAEHRDRVSQSIQSVYRQLTSVLHPDRESDPVERTRKTELMQRVTIAYKEKNLLDLLTLQLEETQMDQASLDSSSEKKIHAYNLILEGQSKDLTFEIKKTEELYRIQFMLPSYTSINPKALMKQIKNDIVMTTFDCERLVEIAELLSTPSGLKVFLKI